MTHNQDFVYATRDYATKLRLCGDLVTRNPQRALDICGDVTNLLSSDTRLKGHREFTGMVEQQVELLEKLAEQKLYSPEQ